MSSSFPPPGQNQGGGFPPLSGPQPPFNQPVPSGGAFPPPLGGTMPASPYSYQSAPRTSPLAIVSLLTGIGAWPMLCCCAFVSIPAGLTAVVTGHLALLGISRSEGRVTGRPLAWLGLAGGYSALIMGAAFVALGVSGAFDADKGAVNNGDAVTAAEALTKIELKINSNDEGIAHGNSPKAIELAKRYSETMLRLREELFTPEEKGAISLTDGQFITWCELRDDKCAFVVNVPSYRKFEGDAKESLAELAWAAAQETVAGELKEGDSLAVGLKGLILFGDVMVGKVGPVEGETPDYEKKESDKELLYPFLEPEEAAPPSTDEPAIEMPADESATAEGTPKETNEPESGDGPTK